MSKEKHLEMIQGIINRKASNSFMIKGWSIVLVSAFFALAGKNATWQFALMALFPALMLWILDGYFLRQERLYRKLYDSVRQNDGKINDFTMDTSRFVKRFRKSRVTSGREKVDCWLRVCFSKTLFIFHGIIVATILMVARLLWYFSH